MTNTFSYSTKAPHVPKWTLTDRLTKSRNEFGMSMKAFSAYTQLSMRQIQYAEGGKGKVSDVIVTVYAAKTGVDYWWLKTGNDPNTDPNGRDEMDLLLGLDSNQEPIGSFLAYQLRKAHGPMSYKYQERAA
jgi:hypothetical protein